MADTICEQPRIVFLERRHHEVADEKNAFQFFVNFPIPLMKLSVLGKICQTFPKLEQHKSKASRENEFHKKNIATGEKSQTIPPFVTSPIFDVHVHPCHPALPFSSIFTYLYPFSAIFIHFDPPSTIFIHCYPFSSIVIHFHPCHFTESKI